MYQRFSATEDFSKFDYIIVGSGIGGLCTAVFLSKAGKKVLVLERHYVPGGFSHTFKRNDGFVWDVGVHYVGNMDEQKSFLRKIFNFLTDNNLKWASMGEVYDEVNIGDEKYSFIAGKENLRLRLHEYFPGEKSAIDQYFKKIQEASSWGALFFLQKSFPKILQLTVGWFFRKKFYKYSSQKTYDVLRALTSNEKLISVLCAQCGNYGLPPRKSSFGAHALVTNHFLDGGYYPVGGADQIYKELINTLQRNGGEVRIKADVERIVVERGTVKGVVVGGHFIACEKVISNAGVQNTFGQLVHKSINPQVHNSVEKIKPSTGHLCLYVGLDKPDSELGLPKNNVWFYEDYNFDEILAKNAVDAPLRFAYISFPSAKDPSWSEKHPHQATMQAIGPAEYDWFKAFEDGRWRNRGDVYECMKNAFKEKMLEKLYELFPQIKGHVVCSEVSSPLSTKHFTNYQHGEIYGLEHSPERFKLNSLLPKSKIKGLYLVGQDIVTVGVGGALASSMLCATSILKFAMAKQFQAIAKGR